ncbi:hypothetical protein F3Y22_tig00112249pilonHSYRG00358 [Hibiscus syriacus]|uniref:Disease resistance protein Roq1-like winged-helix domain-containing protein n=1 Tax=Hibiscus syriacus TaxID=106335 RepID=A0A6A2X3M9_HIBSY|nr:hypothetical protein F3Y22_tig00112249pilonHSYRG00358 [Hibiscus syriacus]
MPLNNSGVLRPVSEEILETHIEQCYHLKRSTFQSRQPRYRTMQATKHKDMAYVRDMISQIFISSFDALDESEKNIFLDTACLFRGDFKEEVEEILSCLYKGAMCGISNLLDKSLLHMDSDGRISMHDMLEEMGKGIVHRESKNPRKRKRLWSLEDMNQVLKYNKTVDSVSFSDELRYLRWDFFPLKSLSSFNPKNLVVLKLTDSCKEQLWKEDHQDLLNLRSIDLSNCNKLRNIPDLSGAINLQSFYCNGCENLVKLPCLNHLASLEKLDLSGCKSLRKIPSLSRAINLQSICCNGCENLIELPCLNHLASLEKLGLSDCKSLMEIPNLSGAINLQSLCCNGCENLVEIPSLNQFVSLEILDLYCCRNLRNEVSANEFEHRSVNSRINLKIAPNGCSGSRFLEMGGTYRYKVHVFIVFNEDMIIRDNDYDEASFFCIKGQLEFPN